MQKTSDDKFPAAKPKQTVMALVTLCGFLEFNFFAINYERRINERKPPDERLALRCDLDNWGRFKL